MSLKKAEEIEQMVAAAVNAGAERHLETVDFNDPNRPKTCLEVDFPILPINQIAQIEGNAGKPIYQMSKWWARRRSSVFRSTLIAAAAKAPEDQAEAAKLVWENYYANHQKNAAFRNLKVADIFMGGGTTLVEGARLGMQMYGNDLNPVAWLVVKNELANVDLEEVKRFFAYIEAEVKPQIMPFYACEGPNGEKGTWYHIETKKKMGSDFDPLAVPPEERKQYRYEGPEVIYTFWAKHGPCSAPGCNHRTPLFSSPVIAVKELSVKTWENQKCNDCGKYFDVEAGETRMAPDEPLINVDKSDIYTVLQSDGIYYCPHCGRMQKKNFLVTKSKVKSKNKKVLLTLLIHPDWMKGAPGKDSEGELGGTVTSSLEATKRWNELRQSNLKLIEIRGKLPNEIYVEDVVYHTDQTNVTKKAHFTCQQETCGREQNLLKSIKDSGDTGPIAPYLLHCYSNSTTVKTNAYNGRYFKSISKEDVKRINSAIAEWNTRKESDLKDYWPRQEIIIGAEIGPHDVEGHHYKHWNAMFNSKQMLIHSLILKTIDTATGFSAIAKEILIGAFQQYLRNQNMFCFWNASADKMEPLFSDNRFAPKNTSIENSVFPELGRGNWNSCVKNTLQALEWCQKPWELVSNEKMTESNKELFSKLLKGKSTKVFPGDVITPSANITCGSSTELKTIKDASIDLVITDPPFSELIQYAELSDFFYVWLQIYFKNKYPEIYTGQYTPKTLEAVANRHRHPDDSDDFYKRVLTNCWREAHRILKPSGLLSFTFHHGEDEPWIDVLESLFNAGFFLEATYPVRGDETKGDKAQFGSQTIEYDVIHVCRKRTEEPTEISWPKLRRQILRDVRQLQDLLEHHQHAGLPEADIEVIKRGKALEYFSRHYGKVYVEEGREFTVKEALAGINVIIQDQSGSDSVKAPDKAEPLTRQFLRIFADKEMVERDQMQKFLRGSGVGPSDFLAHKWCVEIAKPKAFVWMTPQEFAKEKKSNHLLRRDLDQAFFLIGACFDGSGINAKKEMNTGDFKPHPALGELLSWLALHGPAGDFRNAAATARQLFSSWSAENQAIMSQQMSLFDLAEE